LKRRTGIKEIKGKITKEDRKQKDGEFTKLGCSGNIRNKI